MLLHSEQTSGRVHWHRRRRWDLRAWWLCGLTRIRLQLAIYFCLHRGEFAGKHGKLASQIETRESKTRAASPANIRINLERQSGPVGLILRGKYKRLRRARNYTGT